VHDWRIAYRHPPYDFFHEIGVLDAGLSAVLGAGGRLLFEAGRDMGDERVGICKGRKAEPALSGSAENQYQGRTASYPTAPSQIPACGILAPGFSKLLALHSVAL